MGDIGFINIYSPIDSHLCKTIARELPTNCKWIMLDDFNMLECRCDKSSSCGRILLVQESLLINALKNSIQVAEYPLTTPSLTFSWDNSQSDGAQVMACLDCCYIFSDSNSNKRSILEYKIQDNSSRSDYFPISVFLKLEKVSPCPSRYIMSLHYFDHVEVGILQIWLSKPFHVPFFYKLKTVTQFFRHFCICQAQGKREEEEYLSH